MPKTLASFLADRPEDDLREMLSGIRDKRERLKAEDDDLAFEERLVEQALGRKSRRTGPTAGRGRVTKEQVFKIVSGNVGPRFKAGDAQQAMLGAGHQLALENLRQHLRRLSREGKFGREGEWYLNPRAPEQPPAANGAGRTIQAFPNPVATGDGKDREIGTLTGSPQGVG